MDGAQCVLVRSLPRTPSLGCHTAIGGKKLGKSKPNTENYVPCLEMLLFPHLLVIYTEEKDKGQKKKKNRGKQRGGRKQEIEIKRKKGQKSEKKKKKRSPPKRSSKRALLIDQSPAKQIFCQIICPKSKARTQQAPLPAVLPTKQESAKPPVPAALLKSPRDTSPGPAPPPAPI